LLGRESICVLRESTSLPLPPGFRKASLLRSELSSRDPEECKPGENLTVELERQRVTNQESEQIRSRCMIEQVGRRLGTTQRRRGLCDRRIYERDACDLPRKFVDDVRSSKQRPLDSGKVEQRWIRLNRGSANRETPGSDHELTAVHCSALSRRRILSD